LTTGSSAITESVLAEISSFTSSTLFDFSSEQIADVEHSSTSCATESFFLFFFDFLIFDSLIIGELQTFDDSSCIIFEPLM
jgi:hypothetical protein